MKDIQDLSGLIYSTSNHKKFSLNASNVDGMVNSLADKIIV